MATIIVVEGDSEGARRLLTAVQQALATLPAPDDKNFLRTCCVHSTTMSDSGRGDPFSFVAPGCDSSGATLATREGPSVDLILCDAGMPAVSASHVDAAHTAQPARCDGPRRVRGLLRLEGEYWTIAFASSLVRLRDTKGMRYAAYLLRHPGHKFRALDVVLAVHQGAAPGSIECAAFEESYQPIADRETVSQCRTRLDELSEELDEAAAHNDLGRVDALCSEREWLEHQINEACGLGGRLRGLPTAAERARQAVTKGVCNVVRRLKRDDVLLARHFRQIKTGSICEYRPAADCAIDWEE